MSTNEKFPAPGESGAAAENGASAQGDASQSAVAPALNEADQFPLEPVVPAFDDLETPVEAPSGSADASTLASDADVLAAALELTRNSPPDAVIESAARLLESASYELHNIDWRDDVVASAPPAAAPTAAASRRAYGLDGATAPPEPKVTQDVLAAVTEPTPEEELDASLLTEDDGAFGFEPETLPTAAPTAFETPAFEFESPRAPPPSSGDGPALSLEADFFESSQPAAALKVDAPAPQRAPEYSLAGFDGVAEEEALVPLTVEEAELAAGILPDMLEVEQIEEMPKPEARNQVGPDIGRRKMLLGEMLLAAEAIKEDQLEMALAEQRRTRTLLGEVLVSLGFTTEDVVARTVSEQSGIPYVQVPQVALPPQLLKLVPEDLCRKHKLIAMGVEGAILRLAMANPFDVVALDTLRSTTGLVPFPLIATWDQIQKAVERNFQANESFDETFERLIAAAQARGANDTDDDVNRGPLVELVDQLIVRAADERATDIHIEPEELVIRVRYRVDSILQPGPMIPKKLQAGITARLKVMAGLNIAESRVPQDGRIRFGMKGRQIDLRMSTFLCNYGENIVLRVLDKSSVVLSMEKVGFLPDDLAKFDNLIEKPHGIILVTGPTGSGKTTTLYAALSKLNTIDVNIMTIEDPIEYELNLIRQSQVNTKAGITFASGLRALLRQDPDIILIGEMRDEETAQMAVRAAMTGHLVFSTLHTNTAAGAVNRVVDMGVEPLLVTDTVIAVVGQRLSRMVCPHCKELIPAPQHRIRELERAAEREKFEWNGLVATAKGCSECRFRGYHGRVALFEIFEMTREAQDMILKGEYGTPLVRLARSQGMRTMYDDGLRRVLYGTHTLDELDRVIEHDLKVESSDDA